VQINIGQLEVIGTHPFFTMLFKSVSVKIEIFSIKDTNDNNLFDLADIAKEFVNYFKTILCSTINNDRTNLETTIP
jgi:hypothetical protein